MTDTLDRLLACRPIELPIELLTHDYLRNGGAFSESRFCSTTNHSVSKELADCVEHTSTACANSADNIRRKMATADGCARIIDWFRRRRLGNTTTGWKFDVDERRRFFDEMPDLVGDRLATANLSEFVAHRRCIERLNAHVRPCWESSRAVCANATAVTAKVIRLALADIEPIIQRLPDVRIIHYVRDPRGIAVSRSLVNWTFSTVDVSAVAETRLLCREMLEDLRAKRRFERCYPGAVITVRYEDFSDDPIRTTERVFEAVGQRVPATFRSWLDRVINVKNVRNPPFANGIRRGNASATAAAWQSRVSYSDVIGMNRNCREVLDLLGYELFPNR